MGILEEFKKYINKKIHSPPDIRIGKKGIHQKIIETADTLLKKRKGVIKIKILKNTATTKQEAQQIAKQLAQKLNADIIKTRGRTAIIARTKDYKPKTPPPTNTLPNKNLINTKINDNIIEN